MAGTGPRSWAIFKKTENVWIAGREIGSGDNLQANITFEDEAPAGGVAVGNGFFHQATRPSPKAPTGAYERTAFSLAFRPQLDEDTYRHIEACRLASTTGAVSLWLPWPRSVAWKISTGRTQYTLPCLISGSAATWPGKYFEPIVEIRDVAKPDSGALDSTLAFAASSPGSTEFTLANTTANQQHITTGNLDAKAGKTLNAWVWGIWEVQVLSLGQGYVAKGEIEQDLSLQMAPSPRDYEAD